MEYQYVGYTLDRGIVKGRIEADSEAAARTDIDQRGYKLLQVKSSWQPPRNGGVVSLPVQDQ